MDIYLHGEVCIKKVKGSIPEGAKLIKPVDGSYKIADSESTGNHHLLEHVSGLDMYEKDGMFYVRHSSPVTMRCVDRKRHDDVVIEPCKEDEILIFDKQQEVDHLTDEVRNVMD